MWDNENGVPRFVLQTLHELEAHDGDDNVVLRAARPTSFNTITVVGPHVDEREVRDLRERLYLVRAGMVFPEDSIPRGEKARMAKLFGL